MMLMDTFPSRLEFFYPINIFVFFFCPQIARCQPEVIKKRKKKQRAKDELSKLTELESFLT
jgi:hypothetical protein